MKRRSYPRPLTFDAIARAAVALEQEVAFARHRDADESAVVRAGLK